jgi:hypothetical protein
MSQEVDPVVTEVLAELVEAISHRGEVVGRARADPDRPLPLQPAKGERFGTEREAGPVRGASSATDPALSRISTLSAG